MQTPLSQATPFPELFTRERRRTRMRQFLDTFENGPWSPLPAVPEFAPMKLTVEPTKRAGSPVEADA